MPKPIWFKVDESVNIDPNDIDNGWYALPPVTFAMLDEAVRSLVMAGAPSAPLLTATPVGMPGVVTDGNGHIVGNNPNAPRLDSSRLIWMRGGKQVETDAVYTYYGTDAVWVSLCQGFNLPFIPLVKKTQIEVHAVPSPIGTPYPEKGENCYRSAGAQDQFTTGATWTDRTGTYIKRHSWWGFIGQPYWEKQVQ